MLGSIIKIVNEIIYIKPVINIYEYGNIIGKHIVFESKDTILVGEVINISENFLEAKVIGEITNSNFTYGNNNYPAFGSKVRLITKEELDLMFSNNTNYALNIGTSANYKNYNIYLNTSSFFSNHFAILGNTGSGKSWGVATILQSIFYDNTKNPFRSNIFLFDAYGEYQQVFSSINKYNTSLNYKLYTTDLNSTTTSLIKIPFYMLDQDDIAILLSVEDPKQIQIIEKALKLVIFFKDDNKELLDKKNDIIARCILDIIFSGKNPAEIRNKITSILTKFNTENINLEINLTKGGWTRTIRQCLFIEKENKFADIEIIIEYLETFVKDNFELSFPNGSFMYDIKDFYNALEFALINEGVFNSDKVFDYANILKIRLSNIINSNYSKYFEYDSFITKGEYIKDLLRVNNGKAQVINFNISHIDDRFAKTIVKIYSKLLFNFITSLEKRAEIPFHIILEEAHRYVQNDTDTKVLGYNIFDRITKEGRKFGILLGLISQRPAEISETAISQCSNFLIFKMFHPKDLSFIEAVIPNIDKNSVNKIKALPSGNCMIFGNAFKIPVIVNMKKPEPTPLSNNCDIINSWYIN